RVHDAAQPTPILGDAAAAATALQIRQHFGEPPVSVMTRVGCCLRNLAVDQWLGQLVDQQRVETAVVIGVGLDTRRQRLVDLDIALVEIDSPAVIDLRDRWIPADGAVRVTGDGLHIDAWRHAIDASGTGKVAIILEGVLAYQQPENVTRFFSDLARFLPGAYLLFDSPSPIAARSANRPQPGRSERPAYTWAPWSTRRLGGPAGRLTILDEKGFMDFPSALTACFRRRDRVLHSLPPLRRSYRMTLAQVPGGIRA
ncbi:MAG: hypothetical protein AUG49_01485, partial [Catenulispora sp. 13_1_20CM_3_70_7]